ncbi:bifunctional diaminohydroxyphosphoribosylaminopyrimidine deaminase/5-amino-6-(5-phosphoribosylamino)uracil reductase RibD [Shewanella sp. 202IG2-18]|uniref:bifunctional diaminohydroxyphosphoribosylaminopyrimidine deaminase/5-amino-6-(5-phosphoribosylamino)uracil reductase RibD n=1 Tax=Parashewanella hymeniacidonis TaxID=2807618 RepID=UPI0019607435|nr:bifunctional diaminohydroxyphosphoribosylaminopyrimidine deaminase/5-amino-6-(5-phosphoribosylamino)uracil reductase RibD [Parashewanella hymeniacidonis]MBM7071020.1 bifunctional diaminohydroxyphosphoribosylaminopyrimidine deaminase/5-amino-6-(5-phosphoribosylamino)uracil reductase RibD [Parashewanella hymeniacidonis]
MWSTFDRQMMTRAIQLARQGQYTTRPNPNVGCVFTIDEQIIGEGYHQRTGQPHAEVNALIDADYRVEGATAYVTLEPCSHFGLTPPCAQALIDNQVSRVVIACQDPNPQVSGRGISMLKDAGIQVDIGLYEQEAASLNLGFLKKMATGIPWVTVKIAASLDGKTALANGVSKWITGAEARRDVQRLRLKHCAVITGINTVLADDCSLNVRKSELGSIAEHLDEVLQPLRVVLDSNCRMPIDSKMLEIESPVLLVSTQPYPDDFTKQLPNYVTMLTLNAVNKRIDLNALLSYLGNGCNSVLVEAGATLAGSMMEHDLADELVLYQAPKILGSHGRNMLESPNYTSMTEIPNLTLIDERKLGDDTRFRFHLTK